MNELLLPLFLAFAAGIAFCLVFIQCAAAGRFNMRAFWVLIAAACWSFAAVWVQLGGAA